MSKSIILAAGGTGGHVFPAISTAHALERAGADVIFLTDTRGSRYLPGDAPWLTHILPVARLPRGIIPLARGLHSTWQIFQRYQPHAVAGFGGYAMVPAALLAKIQRVPLVLHEQNAILGRANRRFIKSAKILAMGFAETTRVPSGITRAYTGTPVQCLPRTTPYQPPKEGDDIRIVVVGGSLGAKILGQTVPAALISLPDTIRPALHVTQQCRAEDLQQVQATYQQAGIRCECAPFFPDIASRYRQAHLAICRAGAATIAELQQMACPAIFFPYPHATDRHQHANAAIIQKAGGGWLADDKTTTSAALEQQVLSLLQQPAVLRTASDRIAALAKPHAAEELAQLILHQC